MYKVNEREVMGEMMYSITIGNNTIPLDINNMDFYDAIKAYKNDSSCFDFSEVSQETIDLIDSFVSKV